MAHDIESVLDNVKVILQANINNVISAINTEKNDDASLLPVNDGAYCFQSLDDTVHNYEPVVLYGVVDIANDNNGPYNANKVTVAVYIIACDDTDANNMTRRMFRYQRALKQTLESNWQSGKIGNKISINSMLPARIAGLNSSNEHRVVGIEFTTDIT